MKKMRQTLALLLAGALTVGSFAGCGGSKAGGETAGTENSRHRGSRHGCIPAATHRSLSQMTV